MRAQEKMVSQRSVDLALTILGGNVARYAYFLEFMFLHFPHYRVLKALEWLHYKGVVGDLFAEYVENECESKPLLFCKKVFAAMERVPEPLAIYAKDLL